MKNVDVGLQALSISCLQFPQFRRLWFVRINREALIDEQIPDFFPTLASVKRFVLRVAHPTKLLVRCRRARAVTLTHQLHNTFALIDFFPQHGTKIAGLGSKNVLPHRLVT